MPLNKDCNQCRGSGQVADVASFPKPAWPDFENRPRGGPDPMSDFVKPIPCPTCFPTPQARLSELARQKNQAVTERDFEKAALIRDQMEEMQPELADSLLLPPLDPQHQHPDLQAIIKDPPVKGAPCEVVILTLAKLLRTKALGYKQRAETLGGLADVAEKLEPGSAAETAFIEFVKTQGVDL